MSDVEQEDDELLENPEPEADSTPEAEAQPESEHQSDQAREEHVNPSGIEQATGSRDDSDVLADADESEHLPESQSGQHDVTGSVRCHNNSLAEGDQNQYRDEDLPDACASRSVRENEVDYEHHNEFAAEDEQYYDNVRVDFAGAEWSLEPEENSQAYSHAEWQCEGAEGADVTEDVESEQSDHSGTVPSYRTESSSQLTEYFPAGSGAGCYGENTTQGNEGILSDNRVNEAQGASASASSGDLDDDNDCSFEPEGVSVRIEKNNGNVENEPTEADQELQLNSASGSAIVDQDCVPASDIIERDAAEVVINDNVAVKECGSRSYLNQHVLEQGAVTDQNTEHLADPDNLEKTLPEDEISALASSHSRTISVTKSYQPECDQSAMEDTQSESSPGQEEACNVPVGGGEALRNAGDAEEDMVNGSRDREIEKDLNITTESISNDRGDVGVCEIQENNSPVQINVSDEQVNENNDTVQAKVPDNIAKQSSEFETNNESKHASFIAQDTSESDCDKRTEEVPNPASDLVLTKDKGAIPKQRKNSSVKKSDQQRTENGTNDTVKNSKPNSLKSASQNCNANDKSGCKTATVEIDSEEELLSELDATLLGKDTSNHQGGNTDKCAILSERQDEQTILVKPSCEQCLRNNLKCSLGSGLKSAQKGGHSNIPETKELKRQLHQAKQLLLDRECGISRLKEDLEEQYLISERLTLERDSYVKDVECLKTQNSDDLYIPQIKELEYTIAQQQNEVRSFKDKLSSHDAAAKRAIATLQNEMKLRLDQVTKMYEEANKEKDSMVVKFAQAEHKNLECQYAADRAEAKLRDMEKERDAFLVKMKAIKDHRTKLGAQLEAKNVELSYVNKELDKHREMVSSADVRVKWAQNKLKAELEGHKDTKLLLDKMNIKLKEAKEETQQIRQDCQRIIKTYQESEEVKSNSLDKTLKQKESELLENQMQKTNFELAHVKTQRELERIKGELRDSQAQCSALTEKIASLETGQNQSTTTMNKYTEIIQRQKKEVQELRERVETLVQCKSDFMRAQEVIKNLDAEISEVKISNKDLTTEMDACRRRETDKLELTEKLSRKNAELQSENTTLSNKVLNLTGELQATRMEYQDIDTKLKNVSDALANEQKLRREETQSLTTKFAGKCKAVEDLSRKVEEEKDEIKTLKRKHANNIKDLTRQLQQVRRKLESYEASTNGDKDTVSMGSRTSSNGSLNTVNIAEQTNTQIVQPSGHHGQTGNSVHRNPSPEQEYPVITEQVEVDKQVLIERIVKLQRALARKNEKIEFMDDHISQLVDEIQKKLKIIQSYMLKEETGTMTSDMREHAKADLSRKHSIMGSVYSSHSNDGTMTFELSLEINRKLQAVLEDTLLKNMTLKESLDTLGQEIARLSQENRNLQLHIQGKSRARANPSSR